MVYAVSGCFHVPGKRPYRSSCNGSGATCCSLSGRQAQKRDATKKKYSLVSVGTGPETVDTDAAVETDTDATVESDTDAAVESDTDAAVESDTDATADVLRSDDEAGAEEEDELDLQSMQEGELLIIIRYALLTRCR